MSFASLHKQITFLLAGFGLGAILLGGELSMPVQALVVAAFGLSMFAEGPRVASDAWQRGWTWGLVALFVVQLVRAVAGSPLLGIGLEFTAALQISRLANRRSAAEHQQIAILAFLQLCAATVLSSEIAYGAIFLAFVVVVPWMLALTHLRSEIEAQHRPEQEGGAAGLARMLGSRRLVGPSFLVGTAALSLPLFLMTGALFLVFPRVGLGMLSFGRASSEHVAGFGGDVTLGQVGRVRDDPRIVMRVTPGALREVPPVDASIRLRGTSFDHYDGRAWARTRMGHQVVTRVEDLYPIRRMPWDGDGRWSIVLEHIDETVVFLPENTVALDVPPRVESGVEVGRRLTRAPGLDVRYEDEDGLGLRYTAFVALDPEPVRERLDDEARAHYLQLPAGSERVAEWAARETLGAAPGRAQAERLVARLRSFEYSLAMRDPGSRAPLDAFLFEWRAGHCEYFSTALAIGLRTLGVPTRNVTGFLGGRWNEFGRYYAISHGDAHSWVEAWFDGEGWVTLEPTPSGRSELGMMRGALDQLRAVFDAMRSRWDNDVVGYDLRAQRGLARRLVRWLSTFRAESRPSAPGPAPDAPRDSGTGLRPSWVQGFALVGLVTAIALVAWLLRRRSRPSVDDPTPRSVLQIIALYRGLERALAARGHARPPGRTPREHAMWLTAAGFEGAADVQRVTERYLEVRFGGATLDEGEHAELEARVRSLAAGAAASR